MSRLKMKRKKALAEQLEAKALVSTVEEVVVEEVVETQPLVKKTKKKTSDEEE